MQCAKERVGISGNTGDNDDMENTDTETVIDAEEVGVEAGDKEAEEVISEEDREPVSDVVKEGNGDSENEAISNSGIFREAARATGNIRDNIILVTAAIDIVELVYTDRGV